MDKMIIYMLAFVLGFMLRGCINNVEGFSMEFTTVQKQTKTGQNACSEAFALCNGKDTGNPSMPVNLDGVKSNCSSLKTRCDLGANLGEPYSWRK